MDKPAEDTLITMALEHGFRLEPPFDLPGHPYPMARCEELNLSVIFCRTNEGSWKRPTEETNVELALAVREVIFVRAKADGELTRIVGFNGTVWTTCP